MKIIFLCLFLVACSSRPKNSASGGTVLVPGLDPNKLTGVFPYEFKVDTIAYMSCDKRPSGSSRESFFTFKVGAYKPGAGLKLSQAFTEAVQDQKFFQKKQYFDSAYKGNQTDWTLQLSLRNSNDDRPIVDAKSNQWKSNFSAFFNGGYGKDRLLKQLLNQSTNTTDPYLRYQKKSNQSTGEPDFYRYFQQSIGTDALWLKGDTITKINNNEAQLVLAYTTSLDFKNNRPSIKTENLKRFQLTISAPSSNAPTDYRKLAAITEQGSSNQWVCGSYQIARDIDRQSCMDNNNNNKFISSAINNNLKIAVENVWGSSGFWKFNHNKKCAVYQLSETISGDARIQKNICYQDVALYNTQPRQQIEYRGSCDSRSLLNGIEPGGVPYCPHLLSTCWLQ